jgi:hypothetical protein
LVASPHDASILYLPIHGDVTTPYKCKGKEERGSEVYNIKIGSWPKGTTPVMVRVSYVCWKFVLFNL